ncbi:MAG: XdhC family protein [Solirubrobacteraceae bacterium]
MPRRPRLAEAHGLEQRHAGGGPVIGRDLAERMQRLAAERQPFVQATVVRAVRPTSARPGNTALVLADGTIEGFVGGTCAETSVRLHAARALETGEAVVLRIVPDAPPDGGEPAAEDGVAVAHNPCLSGGTLEVFLDPQLPAPRIVIAGDTPIAIALEGVAQAAGYAVLRGKAAAVVPDAADAAVIVASHGNDEEALLTRALEAGVGYVGLVASPVRGAAVLAALDVGEDRRAAVHTPAGLDIGARAPGDVAIAILAELVAGRSDRAPAPAEPAGEAVAGPLPTAVQIAIDPICGMEVVAAEASLHLDIGGERFYFCREGCRDTYAKQRAGDGA